MVIEFPDYATALACYNSPEYQANIKVRQPHSVADIVIIEGYKREPIPKIEARRLEAAKREPLAPSDPFILAIAADHAVEGTALPVFNLDDTNAIVDFVIETTGLNT